MRIISLVISAIVFALPLYCRADHDVVVTGSTSGNVWGSGPYTDDSSFPAAAVHSGIITVGQTATIRIRNEGTLNNYLPSVRNGVSTYAYSSPWAAVSLSMVTSSQAPTVSLIAPASVSAGATFTVTVNATDANGDLNSHSLRYQGVGLVNWWTISGSSASHSETIIAPSTAGVIYFRTECTDVAGNGTTGGWVPVQVVASTNVVPTASITGPSTAQANSSFSVTVSASDSNGNLAGLALVRQNVSPPNTTLQSWSVSGSSSSRSATVTAPSTASTMYLRAEATDTAPASGVSAWHAVSITSPTNPTISVTPSSLPGGGALTVNYTGASGTSSWIGLFAVGEANSQYKQSTYTPGGGTGTTSFTLNGQFLVGVTYVARLFQDNGFTDVATSNTFQVTSNLVPTINTHPQNLTVGVGGSATFSVSASGPPTLTYQWRKDGTALPGATALSYTVSNAQSANAGAYTVVVTNPYGSVTSSTATLAVSSGTPPSITTQPISQTVNAGGNVSFTVSASGTAPFSYQWRKNGTPMSGMVSSTLSISNVQSADAANYSVVVSNSAGSATSTTASLTVNASSPAITTQPQNQTSAIGGSVTFSVTATGVPAPTYQWRKDGIVLSGATSSTYTISSANSGHVGSYSVVVANAYGSVTSSNATLTLTTVPVITTQPSSQTVNAGTNVGMSVVATGSAPLSYQWRKNGVNVVGATSSTLTLNSVQSSDAGTYTVVVSNGSGSTTSSAATLAVNSIPAISTQPQSQTVGVGGTINLSVVATGSAPMTYQWRKGGINISGATTSTYVKNSATTGDAGSYTVNVSNSAGSVLSSSATVTVNSVTIDLQIHRPN